MSDSEERVFRLGCATQSYKWGKPAASSEVAKLSSSGNPTFRLDNEKPYAELWMGTHPKGPSVVLETGETLTSWVGRHPECIGSKTLQVFPLLDSGQLPFLFKVLSVGKALSIQAHPNKSHAEKLHRSSPNIYPDPNHKPEMAIALTVFKAMCGFRPKEEISSFFQNLPELATLVGDPQVQALSEATTDEQSCEAVHNCFTSFMTNDPNQVQKELALLVKRLSPSASDETSTLVLELNTAFPGDIGCFCVYFLNVLTLQPGQAIFLEANLPHVYLAGDCIECMACSDNVVRAGLTPKLRDVDVLCSMLNYQCLPLSQHIFSGKPVAANRGITLFDPPIPDFSVIRYQIPTDLNSTTLAAVDGASILLVIQGEAHSTGQHQVVLCRGAVLFIAANKSLQLTITSAGMLMFRAFCAP